MMVPHNNAHVSWALSFSGIVVAVLSCEHGRPTSLGGVSGVFNYDRAPATALIARHAAATYPYECDFGGARLSIDEGVFCPTLTNASPLLLQSLQFAPFQRVMDVFAGCGAFGIVAAMHGSYAVTIDVSVKAVACTLRNATMNSVEDRVDARVGTLADCVAPNETFDLVVANPPLLPGQPFDDLTGALFDPGLQATVDLVMALPSLLSLSGRCYLLTSDVADRHGCDVAQLCAEARLKHAVVQTADVGYERYRVHLIERTQSGLRAHSPGRDTFRDCCSARRP
ncbi:methyltransferase [Actinoplanes sp. NPDC051470]|uniref:methyltransferase n=1 Tax=Actinoplanes sp. NPDC051470 TaxID=3157224 RepID=UPI003447CBE6